MCHRDTQFHLFLPLLLTLLLLPALILMKSSPRSHSDPATLHQHGNHSRRKRAMEDKRGGREPLQTDEDEEQETEEKTEKETTQKTRKRSSKTWVWTPLLPAFLRNKKVRKETAKSAMLFLLIQASASLSRSRGDSGRRHTSRGNGSGKRGQTSRHTHTAIKSRDE